MGSDFEITNLNTQTKYWLNSDYNFDLGEVTMNDLSIVERNGQITLYQIYIYKSNIPIGLYEVYLTYGNRPFMNNLQLSQVDGRIWVGTIHSKVDTLEVN